MKVLWCKQKGCRMIKIGNKQWEWNIPFLLDILRARKEFTFSFCPCHEPLEAKRGVA